MTESPSKIRFSIRLLQIHKIIGSIKAHRKHGYKTWKSEVSILRISPKEKRKGKFFTLAILLTFSRNAVVYFPYWSDSLFWWPDNHLHSPEWHLIHLRWNQMDNTHNRRDLNVLRYTVFRHPVSIQRHSDLKYWRNNQGSCWQSQTQNMKSAS